MVALAVNDCKKVRFYLPVFVGTPELLPNNIFELIAEHLKICCACREELHEVGEDLGTAQ